LSVEEKVIESSKIYWMKNTEAEMLKYVKNCFLAAKVGLFNEIYDLCEKKKIDYSKIKEMLLLDPRIGHTHMNVPGYNNLRGFGGTCFPKDTHSLYSQF
jgi:UDP-glucose 6-dehydrogenase